ncbi:unnamed protein product, partial [Brenthis ino]
MSAEKLSTDEVPQKFAEWLLAMGCPVEKVPSTDKMKQMCRGQYYMVWRSLMEHVQAKDVIRQKRLQVFYDDVNLCKEKNAFNENNAKITVPEQVQLWRQYVDLNDRVSEAETRVEQAQRNLKELRDKISCKVTQRNASRRRVDDLQRRIWFLRQVSSELTAKKANLEETKVIADSLCNVDCDQDIQNKLDKYLIAMQQKSQPTMQLSNPIASSSIVSTHESEPANNEKEENIMSLVKCRGDALWPHLYEKRAAVVTQLSLVNMKQSNDIVDHRITPQSVLAHTAALHCNIALEVMKNKVHLKQTRDRFAAAIEELSTYVTGESCELLVLRCEKARTEARVKSLKSLYDELTSKSGVFHIEGDDVNDNQATPQKIANIDKCIENTRDDLKRLITVLATTERKINNIKECLVAVFSAFHSNSNVHDIDRCRGIQLDFPKESISTLRQYYIEKCEKNKMNGNLSLDLDVSEASFTEASDASPRFIDELKIYLKKFNLEKNRKLVLDSGEKIWIFETVQFLASKLNLSWLNDDIPPLLCPSVRLSRTMQELKSRMQEKDALMSIVKAIHVQEKPGVDIDITSKVEQEGNIADKLKKKISENSILLQKISKTLDLCQENLKFWSEDQMKGYISDNRTVNGKTYKDYEAFYLENLKLKS